jgi:shikimate kinase
MEILHMNDLMRLREQLLSGQTIDLGNCYHGDLFLIGFMGAGKSTVARTLSQQCGLTVVEMDSEIQRRAGMTINDIFAQQGEAAFRQMETDLITTLDRQQHYVVSCGGGTPMRQVNVDAMRARGTILWLTAQPETILERVSHSHDRPLLEGHKDVPYIRSLLEQRRPKYASAADCTIPTDGKTALQICGDILAALSQLEKEQ